MSTQSALLATPPQPFSGDALAPAAEGDIRVYRGRSIDELIPRIEAELGADAIVVRRRRGLEGGIGGFFQRPFVEVEAKPGTPRIDVYDERMGEPALPPAPRAASSLTREPAMPMPAMARPAGAYVTDTLATIAAAGAPEPGTQDPPVLKDALDLEDSPVLKDVLHREDSPVLKGALHREDSPVVEDPPRPAAEPPAEFRELTPDTFGAALAEAEQALPHLAPPAPAPARHPDPFGEELDMLDRGIHDLQAVTRPRSAPAPIPSTPLSSTPRHARARASLERGMTGVGMSEELAAELVDAAIVHALPFAPRIGLAKAVHGAVAARIPRNPLLPAQSATVAVVGPGGSGKTSCCAALLAVYRRAGTSPASCATIVLVGEREEPAMLLSPQIMEPEAIASMRAKQALTQAREEGLLLLDMPPLSPADRSSIRQMASVLDELRPDRVVVALPATLGARAAAQLLETLRPLRATAMAITHADETDQLGVAVEAACEFGLAPEYLLDRGRVRGGLTRIDPTHLADRLLP